MPSLDMFIAQSLTESLIISANILSSICSSTVINLYHVTGFNPLPTSHSCTIALFLSSGWFVVVACSIFVTVLPVKSSRRSTPKVYDFVPIRLNTFTYTVSVGLVISGNIMRSLRFGGSVTDTFHELVAKQVSPCEAAAVWWPYAYSWLWSDRSVVVGWECLLFSAPAW